MTNQRRKRGGGARGGAWVPWALNIGGMGLSPGDGLSGAALCGGWTLLPVLSMPSRLIFDSSVCRGIPSFAAAPEGPEMRPWVSASAAAIISASRSASAESPS